MRYATEFLNITKKWRNGHLSIGRHVHFCMGPHTKIEVTFTQVDTTITLRAALTPCTSTSGGLNGLSFSN